MAAGPSRTRRSCSPRSSKRSGPRRPRPPAVRCSWPGIRNPRALTDAERVELRADLDPVLRDMRSSGAIVPDVLEEAHEYCVQSPDGAGSPWSIHVQVGLSPPERLVGLADQLQEWEIEELAAAGRPATWPECPQHPDSHPLAPRASDDQAVWCCPASGQVISVIGALRPR